MKYKIGIVQDQEEERYFQHCWNIASASGTGRKKKIKSYKVFEFNTVEEAEGFIRGIEVGLGRLPMFFRNQKLKDAMLWQDGT
jgi:hypothetical protein